VEECVGCGKMGADVVKIDAGGEETHWHRECWQIFAYWIRGDSGSPVKEEERG